MVRIRVRVSIEIKTVISKLAEEKKPRKPYQHIRKNIKNMVYKTTTTTQYKLAEINANISVISINFY